MTEPTDKELEAFAIEEQFLLFCDIDEFTQIARAVLAKWGTPAPVGVEPIGVVGYTVHGTQYVNWLSKAPAHGTPIYTTPQPAVREPLTDEQIRAMCKESWVFETVKQWVRITEQHHGIKGGQHGTE